MDTVNEDDLSLLYELFCRVDAVEILSKKFLSYIKVSGKTKFLKLYIKEKIMFADYWNGDTTKTGTWKG